MLVVPTDLEEIMLAKIFGCVAVLVIGLFALIVWYVSHEMKSYE